MENITTRREENRQVRRAAIVATARAAFLEQGYAATTMSTIAGLMGGSKGTLWAYFPSKEALFDAVLDDLTAAFRRDLQDALRPGRDVATTLTGFAERFLAKLVSPAAISLQRLIIGEAGRAPEVGRMFFERGPREVLAALQIYLAAQMAAGRLFHADPMLAARYLVGLLQSYQVRLLWNVAPQPDAEQIRGEAAHAAATFLRAYAP